MPPIKHAVLSASSSHRWLNCTPSAQLERSFENKDTIAAAEGTAAHALCEYKLRKALDEDAGNRPVSEYDSQEMEDHTSDYVSYVLEQLELAKKNCSDPLLLIEQRLDFSSYVPDGFGTGDCLIISDDTLHIIDFKYGVGVLVEAENNPQMMLYALGALSLYDSLYDIKNVSMTIFQPRRENVSTWEIPVSELLNWAENELRPKAQLANKGEGEFCCGEWCTFCRAKVKCRARAEACLELAKYEFQTPPLLEDSEIEEILEKIDTLTAWASSIKDYAFNAALQGKQWNNFKLVEGRSNRKYTDEEQAAEAVKSAGFDPYEHKIIGITAMTKLLGKSRFEELLKDFIYKPQGKPVLVPMSDKRPAINTAQADFSSI
ncbi:MAG: DUF2800 domain-containing protein [Clostridium sp.]|nr:DUF2800 domain-containing protein [Clostridium sp.]